MIRNFNYLGLYLASHIKGPAAFPIQLADRKMAFVVIFFVCPAVTFDTQDKERTKPVMPTPTEVIVSTKQAAGQKVHTTKGHGDKEAGFIVPG